MSRDRTRWKPPAIESTLVAIFAIGLLLRLYAAQFPNLIHPDSIFQTLEPAHRLAFGYGLITWEWRMGIRSWVFPAFLAAVMRMTAWMGPGSSGYLWGISAILSLFSLVTVWFGFVWAKRASGTEAAVIAAGACAVWFDLVIFAPCALTEVVATHVLLPGLYLGRYAERVPERRRMFLAALCCGLAASLRIELAPAVGFALVHFCHPNWRKRALPLAAGFLLPIVAFGLVDAFTWTYPFQSFWKYFWVNAIQDRSALYGTRPWFWYLLALVEQMFPVVVLALFGLRRSPFLGWLVLIILSAHSIIAHKELRFIYPAFPILLTLAAIGFADLSQLLATRLNRVHPVKNVTIAIGLIFFALLSYLSAPLFPYWQKNSVGIEAFDRLSRDPTICGLALYRVFLLNTGGYAHLHKDIPIFPIQNAHVLSQLEPSFNVILTIRHSIPSPNSFSPFACWNGVCLYQRVGPCALAPKKYDANAVLADAGQ